MLFLLGRSFKEISARQQDEELRRHDNQAEESRISLAKNKMRNELMGVALGELGKAPPCVLLSICSMKKLTHLWWGGGHVWLL